MSAVHPGVDGFDEYKFGEYKFAFPLLPRVSTSAAMQDAEEMWNWNLSYSCKPAKVVMARDIPHVQEVVSSPCLYPSPVTPVGAMHSVNECVVNNGGTLLCMLGLNKVLGLVGCGESKLVTVQAGVKTKDLHEWLAYKGAEISFSPEIGDATIGSLVTTTSKDSSVRGPGYLSALVHQATYVDAEGKLVTVDRKDAAKLMSLTCSNGLLGIVVEVVLCCRPLQPISTTIRFLPTNSKLAARLDKLRDRHHNLFAIIGRRHTYVELRDPAQQPRSWAMDWYCRAVQQVKYRAFLAGDMPAGAAGLALVNWWFRLFPLIHYRHELVNRYPTVQPSEARLDFTFYEFDLSTFHDVVSGMLQLMEQNKKDTGFVPSGFAMYFVERPGNKPSGSFSGPPGISFMMDPFYGHPTNPAWLAFLDRANAWAASKGAKMSLTQTKRLAKGQCCIDWRQVAERFCSEYYWRFVQGQTGQEEGPVWEGGPAA